MALELQLQTVLLVDNEMFSLEIGIALRYHTAAYIMIYYDCIMIMHFFQFFTGNIAIHIQCQNDFLMKWKLNMER